MTASRKRATIRQVAEATGLSPAAVSYALRGVQVSAETQLRVREAADRLGYEADPIARALACGRSGTVGLLCGSLEDLWQQSLAVGIGRALLSRDRYALILDAGGDPRRELSLARQLRDQRVDALIVQPVDPSAALWAELAAVLPVVAVGDSLAGASCAGQVLFDNRVGVRLALEHLQGMGHRRVTVLTPNLAGTPDRAAELHVAAEARRLDLDVSVVTSPHALEEASVVARSVLDVADPPGALFCFADSIAYGVYAAARSLGMDVPGDVSVVGYDAHPMSDLLTPVLTTVDWRQETIVDQAVRLAVAGIETPREPGGAGRRPATVVQSPILRPGGSTGPPRQH